MKYFFTSLSILVTTVCLAQKPTFIQGKWDGAKVYIRTASLELKDDVRQKAHLIYKGKKNSLIVISSSDQTGPKINTGIEINIGGYYQGTLTVRAVTYKRDYYAEGWHRSVDYNFANGGDLGSLHLYFDDDTGEIEKVSGFIILDKTKKTLAFEMEDWINISYE